VIDNVNRLVDTMKVKNGNMTISDFIIKYDGGEFIKLAGRIPKLVERDLKEGLTGIYFLRQSQKIVYVGQTGNIKTRLSTHQNEKKKRFDNVGFLPNVPLDLLDMVEAYYIDLVKPIYNTNIPIPSRY
tara:strand:+ start:12134 stop:12517 length:384 start_codon:yes stop_codon:yes gene_type:complete